MRIKIYEYPIIENPLAYDPPKYRSNVPTDRGYIDLPNETIGDKEIDVTDCWHICNWSHWTDTKPKELHSDIDHCDHGIVFAYQIADKEICCLALSYGWLMGSKEEIQEYVNKHANNLFWVNSKEEE